MSAPGSQARAPVAGAALVLAALLCALALPGAGAGGPACIRPEESDARDGWTRRVRCGDPAAAPGPALRGPARVLFGLALDPNQADAATLEVLPGIGPLRARAIERAGAERPFARVDDLLRVPGVGPVTLERVRDQLVPGAQDPEVGERR
jgi:hypothetical protein